MGKTVKEVRDKIKKEPPAPPRSLNPKVPQVAEAICLRCLKKRQSERFQKPKDLIEAIDQVLTILDPEGKTAGKATAKSKTGVVRRGTATGLRPPLGKKKPSDPANKAVKGAKSSSELKPVVDAAAEPGTGKFKRGAARRQVGSGTRQAAEGEATGVKGSAILVGVLVVLL